MSFIADHQLPLLLACFAIGCVATGFLFRKPAGHPVWQWADLIWVALGGFGAVAAIVAGLYVSDRSKLDRQIDVAYAATAAFDRDAARFRLRFCDPPHDPDIAVLCEKIEFLSASTASNAELPLFIAVTGEVAPLRGLEFLAGRRATGDREEMEDMAEQFDPAEFLAFAALDDPTQAAVDTVRRKVPAVAGDFLILARSYEGLIEQLRRLKAEWEHLQANAYILVLQVIALCLVSFAAPFRLGKSLADLRKP